MIALGELEQDALTEIFNIGVGLAADALYQMTGEHVPLSVPVVELTSQQTAQDHYGAREQHLYAIRQTYQGEFSTEAVLLFPEESSVHLVRMMVGPDVPDDALPEVAQDAMGELGNIVLNAAISNMASTLGLTLEGTIPEVSVVAADAIFGKPGSGNAPAVLALMIDFELSAKQVRGYLAFLLDMDSTAKLIGHLTRYVGGPVA